MSMTKRQLDRIITFRDDLRMRGKDAITAERFSPVAKTVLDMLHYRMINARSEQIATAHVETS
ncbi:predicted protein [Plenodomus lingam JN3]|uniref:Predicted protein n=1 Tax=Leptosphaeria maculans (strain JN3 / isolate v23.1.3 / race Av1-4-5-6-7-8) TaxID=985895 RepID=E4ZX18_LEPMJ|nr:predicted protein [Plenodomus lingam JN3]CBX95228.1 predicted protein [Plenodomus lingam JN3]